MVPKGGRPEVAQSARQVSKHEDSCLGLLYHSQTRPTSPSGNRLAYLRTVTGDLLGRRLDDRQGLRGMGGLAPTAFIIAAIGPENIGQRDEKCIQRPGTGSSMPTK